MEMKEVTVDETLLKVTTGVAIASIKMFNKQLSIEEEVDTKKVAELVDYYYKNQHVSAEYPYMKENGMFLNRRRVIGGVEAKPFNELSLSKRFMHYACLQATKMAGPVRGEIAGSLKPEPPAIEDKTDEIEIPKPEITKETFSEKKELDNAPASPSNKKFLDNLNI
jgi:hypothetical protein